MLTLRLDKTKIVMTGYSLLTKVAGSWGSQLRMLEKNPPISPKWKDTILSEKFLMICGILEPK